MLIGSEDIDTIGEHTRQVIALKGLRILYTETNLEDARIVSSKFTSSSCISRHQDHDYKQAAQLDTGGATYSVAHRSLA